MENNDYQPVHDPLKLVDGLSPELAVMATKLRIDLDELDVLSMTIDMYERLLSHDAPTVVASGNTVG